MPGSLNLGTHTTNDGKEVRFGADFDDTPKLVTLWCENDSMQGAFGQVKGVSEEGNVSNTAVYGQSFPGKANETDPPRRTVIVIDQAPVNKQIVLRPSGNRPGRYEGYEFAATVPG